VKAPSVQGEVGQLNSSDLQKLLAVIRKRESSNNYKAINTLGYLGGYQFGMAMLEDLGYVKKGSWAKYKKNKKLALDEVWAGKAGISKQSDFLNNSSEQDTAMISALKIWFSRMKQSGYAGPDTPRTRLAGLLMVAHLKGTGKGGVRDFLKGIASPDGYGTSPNEYYNLGSQSIDATTPPVLPNQNSETNIKTQDEPIKPLATIGNTSYGMSADAILKGDPTTMGFIDPDLKYPLPSHVNEPDTHRLARHDKIDKTIVSDKKNNRVLDISLANSGITWKQPPIPYNAVYPHNHTTITEAGHIIELDDSAGSERIHIYHSSGTFIEIDNNGTRVDRVSGTQCTIIEQDGTTLIKGTGVLNIDGDFSVDIKKSLHVEVWGDIKMHVHGNVYQQVDGDMSTDCKNYYLNARENIKVVAKNNMSMRSKNHHVVAKENLHHQSSKYHNLSASSYAQDSKISNINSGKAKPATIASEELQQPNGWTNEQTFVLPAWEPNITEIAVNDSVISNVETYENDDETVTPATTSPSDPSLPTVGSFSAVPTSGEDPKITDFNLSKTTDIIPTSTFTIEYPITAATRLSQNFKLGDLCKSTIPINGGKMVLPIAQHGLGVDNIILNLQRLASTVLEPLLAKFPNLNITSGFRLIKGTKKSRHELGLATDVQLKSNITGLNKLNTCLVIAKYLTETLAIPHVNKVILEYTSGGGAWVHIQINPVSSAGYGNAQINSSDINGKYTIYNHNDSRIGGQFRNGFVLTLP